MPRLRTLVSPMTLNRQSVTGEGSLSVALISGRVTRPFDPNSISRIESRFRLDNQNKKTKTVKKKKKRKKIKVMDIVCRLSSSSSSSTEGNVQFLRSVACGRAAQLR